MTPLYIIQQAGQWLVFDDQHVAITQTRPKLTRAAFVVSEFEGAVSNVISLEGSSAHAVALIEKRLRSDGMIDGESKIIVHNTLNIGAGYQTLFSAVPLELWQQTYAWCEAQPDHCLLIPFTSLLWATLKPRQGIVLQSGRQLSVLARLKHSMVYRTALAYSDDPSDLAMTAGVLADHFAEDLGSDENLEPINLQWCSVLVPRPEEGSPWLDDMLRESFSSRCGVSVNSVPTLIVRDDAQQEYRSGIRWLKATASTSQAANPLASRAAWRAEWALPLASAASLVFALTLGALGARWMLSAQQANDQAERINNEVSEIETRIAAMESRQSIPDNFQKTLDFLERARGLQTSVDPAASLVTIREAADGAVRILRVKLEEPPAAQPNQRAPVTAPGNTGYTLRVDGVVDPARGIPGMQVPTFVERLRVAGFDPQPIDPQGAGANNRSASGFFSYLLKSPAPQQEARS